MLEKLQKCVENSRLDKLPSFERRAKEQLILSDKEKQSLKENPMYPLSDFLKSKSFFYISKLEYSVCQRVLIIQFIDNPDVPIEEANKVVFAFSKILYFSDEWSDENKDWGKLQNIEQNKFIDVIFFDAYSKENYIEYFLILIDCEICFRTSELPEIK
ncbi:MAG: hypothetical protein M3R11_01405 [Acidobacteriota bacterium]|nr:hypothetical protein [Acidobacteriota bacterium]